MEVDPICKNHGKSLQLVCTGCKLLMCSRCLIDHNKACKFQPIDISAYAEDKLLPEYMKQITNFEKDKETIKASIKYFMSSSSKIIEKLIKLKEDLEDLLNTLNGCISIITKDHIESIVKNYRACLANKYEELKEAIKTDNLAYIINKIYVKFAHGEINIGDSERKLIESINNSLYYIVEATKIETLNELLKEFKLRHQSLCEQPYTNIEVKNIFIYGSCSPQNECAKLCKYNIKTRKFAVLIDIPQYSTITQIENRIFLSGGIKPVINSVSEFIERSEILTSKEPMKYTKYGHSVQLISTDSFVTVGGYNDNPLAYCEIYSIFRNKWSLIPTLNTSRY